MTRVQITRISRSRARRDNGHSLFQRVNFDQSRPHGRRPIPAEDNRPVSPVLKLQEAIEEAKEEDAGRKEDEAGTIH